MRYPDTRSPAVDRSSTWRRAEALLHEALDLPASERPAFVERRADGDPALRDEVLSLLAAGTRAAELEEPLTDLVARPAAEEGPIGAYGIVRELGRGGGGVVYLAERADGAFRRRVAIKLLARGTGSHGLRRRLCVERQILADLDHPNIARLHEGGTTADGRPYLVMEYVDGERIDRHCERLALPIRRRLELFLRICRAVSAAHENRIVHRDLKPSNILVDRSGEPRLLDFGIAKILDGGAAPASSDTTVGAAPMTLRYASPEQLGGGPITPATDVYGLGLVLYELLAGERPFERDPRAGPPGGDRLRDEPAPPSRLLRRRAKEDGEPSPDRLRRRARRLEGDLDSVVLQALRRDPEERYPSVQSLADDLARHLANLPVRARRSTLADRALRLARRRARVVAAVLLAVSVLGGLALRHEAQRARADRARERTEAAAAHLAEVFLFSREAAGQAREPVPREVIDHGAAFAADLEDRPELRAELLSGIGREYLGLGLTDEAEPHLQEALDLRLELYGPAHPQTMAGLGDLAWLRTDQGRSREAEALYRRLLRLNLERLGEGHPEVASARNALAASLLDQGRYDEAEPLFRRALATQRESPGLDHRRVAAIAGNLAVVLHYRGRYAEAAELFREALADARRRLPENDGQVIAAKVNLASALREAGRYGEAGELLGEALAVHRSRPPTPGLGVVLENVARNELYRGARSSARERASEAVALYRRLHGEGHPSVARAEILLARILLDERRPEHAERLLRRAAEAFRQGQLPGHWKVSEAESLLGASLLAQGRVAEAEPLLRASHRHIRERIGDLARPAREAAERLAELERRLAADRAAPRAEALLARHEP